MPTVVFVLVLGQISTPHNLTQQMTQNSLQAAKTCFQSSNVVEITVETAREFASTSNICTVNSSTNLNSIKSMVQSLKSQSPQPLRDMWHKVKKLISFIFCPEIA